MPDRMQRSIHETLNEVRTFLEDLRTLGLLDVHVADLQELQPCPPGLVGLDRGGRSFCRQETLEEIRSDLGECCRCPLHMSRKQIVFGDGTNRARVVFVGSAPSRGDDSSGIPFVGDFFERILFAMGLERSSVYTCLVLKCRSSSRTLHKEEITTCFPFIQRQIDAISPQVIVAMGEVAIDVFNEGGENSQKNRGEWCKYRGVDVMPTFDLSYLTLHPHEKREFWNDLKEVMRRLRQDD